jgi:hypothetical protein
MISLKTETKLIFAQLCSKVICWARYTLGLNHYGVFCRSHLKRYLDLTEGIDLSIFLFGSFEPKT